MLHITQSFFTEKKFVLFLLSFFLLSLNTFCQISHTVNFSKDKINLSELKAVDKNNYMKVDFNDFQKTFEIGKPELPVKDINLIVPSNQNVNSIKVNSSYKIQ